MSRKRLVFTLIFVAQSGVITWLCSELFFKQTSDTAFQLLVADGTSPQIIIPADVAVQEEQHQQSRNLNSKLADTKEIRKWGCNRQETPFIFVHIGKSGGGSIRARISAASLNYTKGQHFQAVDGSYYPIQNNENMTIAAARFCSSCSMNSRPSKQGSFEKTIMCHGFSPVGQAVGCPEPLIRREERKRGLFEECKPSMDTCHVVYVGHNLFGSEVHWLPSGYLKKWWASTWSDDPKSDQVLPLFDKLHPKNRWCDATGDHRPVTVNDYDDVYNECSIPNQRLADAKAALAVAKKLALDDVQDWSPVYASMPLLRAALVRNPFSWLISKYAWHSKKNHDPICHLLRRSISGQIRDLQGARPNLIEMDDVFPGWVPRMSLGYIIYLCGEASINVNFTMLLYIIALM